ncbi:MAG: AraC family transcriptional regulator, partial [Chloroflexota bacterium]
LLVGPWSSAGPISFDADAEILWIRFHIGVYMPGRLTRQLLNSETPLPTARRGRVWLASDTWEPPSFDNADDFIGHLSHAGVLTHDDAVCAALRGEPTDLATRTLRHRFLHTTGSSQRHIEQVQRAWWAADLLRAGTPVLDVVAQAGYYDQPHLTRAMRQYIGHTPTQLLSTANIG